MNKQSQNMDRPQRAKKTGNGQIQQNIVKETNKAIKHQKKGRVKVKWIAVACIFVYAAVTFIVQQGVIDRQMKERQQLEQTKTELEVKVKMMQRELEYIGTDEYLEQLAREKFGWVKDGEIIFRNEES